LKNGSFADPGCLDSMHPLLSFNATYTGIMVSYGFYHKHQGWAFSFPYIRTVASSILFYVTFYQLHMPSQDVIPHHPCSGFLKYLKTVQKTLEICPPVQTVTLINL
jgi:hypothetical protein